MSAMACVARISLHIPVVISIALSRPLCRSIDLTVRDCDFTRGRLSKHDVLATDERRLDVVDPDHISPIDSDTISSPNILGVNFGDVNVLDDDVLHSVGHAKTAIPTLACQSWIIGQEKIYPLPLMTPLLPCPTSVLSDPTLIPSTPAAL